MFYFHCTFFVTGNNPHSKEPSGCMNVNDVSYPFYHYFTKVKVSQYNHVFKLEELFGKFQMLKLLINLVYVSWLLFMTNFP